MSDLLATATKTAASLAWRTFQSVNTRIQIGRAHV